MLPSLTVPPVMFRNRLLSAVLVSLVLAANPIAAQGPPQGAAREAMWFAPTAEDWKRPVLLTFQRTWDDAVAVSRETGKPILICVNMDGEIASEHYAGVRYRQPDIAELYEPYVCVIASVYRHNPRDYDVDGNRILCPRFGGVTCGEHIWIEPILYERYFEGVRVAPRHVMVELDGSETYDVYYAFDTESVFKQISDGIAERDAPPPVVRGDRTLVEKLASRDVKDRNDVERAYRGGDTSMRETLLRAAIDNVDKAPDDLLRLAIYGFDPDMARLAREALAKSDSTGAIELINEALRVPLDEEEREKMITALARLGETSERAQTLSVVHRGLVAKSDQIDASSWTRTAGASYAAPGVDVVTERLETASLAPAQNAESRLDAAMALLELAVDPRSMQSENRKVADRYYRMRLEDALSIGKEAESMGASGWRTDALIGLASYYLGHLDASYGRVEKAVEELPSGEISWAAIATISLFAQQRQQAITEALNQKKDWPGEWLTDVNEAFAVLSKHPLGRDVHVADHFRFLMRLGAFGRAERTLEEGLKRFPDSWVLHGQLRSRVLWRDGIEGLEKAYADMLKDPEASPNLPWFAGYASIVAAENHRRQNEPDKALKSYDRALAYYLASVQKNPSSQGSSNHYAAIALAGRARIALEDNDLTGALDQVLASFSRKPEAAASMDGLNLSAVGTAKMLLARLRRGGQTEEADTLDAALARLDPKLLELPTFEQTAPGANPTNWQNR